MVIYASLLLAALLAILILLLCLLPSRPPRWLTRLMRGCAMAGLLACLGLGLHCTVGSCPLSQLFQGLLLILLAWIYAGYLLATISIFPNNRR